MLQLEQQPRILVRGLIPIPGGKPTQDLLTVRLDVTGLFSESGEDYMGWKQRIEEILNTLDQIYAKDTKKLKGRRVEAGYKTVEVKVNDRVEKRRIRVVELMPYPSRFASQLKMIRDDYYELLEEHGTLLYREEFMSIYIIPEARVNSFRRGVEAINEEIEELNREIERFEATSDFKQLINFLANTVPAERWSRPPTPSSQGYTFRSRLHPITIRYFPVMASRDFIEQFVDEETKRQVAQAVRDTVVSVINAERQRLASALTQLAILASRGLKDLSPERIEAMRKTLSEVRSNLQRTGSEFIIRSTLDAMEQLTEALTTRNPQAIQEAINTTAQALGTPIRDTPDETIQAMVQRVLAPEEDQRINTIVMDLLLSSG